MATALVTGAAGHLGANLVRTLLAAGHAVRALVHLDQRGVTGTAAEVVCGDVTDVTSLEAAAAGCDWVFHCAARIQLDGREPERLRAINLDGTRNVIAACRNAGVRRLVHVSSIEALDPLPTATPVDESRPLAERPLMPYAVTKVAADRAVRAAAEAGLDAVIIYPTAMLGPEDHGPSLAGRFLLDLARGELPALVTGGFDWVDARDVALGALAAAERGDAGDRFLLGGRWASAAEVAGIVCAHRGTRPPPVLPRALAWIGLPFTAAWSAISGAPPRFTRGSLSALAHYRQVEHGRASERLGYAPRPLKQTLTETVDWLLERHRDRTP